MRRYAVLISVLIALVAVLVVGAAVAGTTGPTARITGADGETFDVLMPFTVDLPETTTTTTLPPTTTTTRPPVNLVIDSDVTYNEALVLRAGDSIEFRNGARLSFGPGGYADWQGTPTSTWSDEGAVQNLDRDVDIYGAGDIRFEMGSLASIIKWVEVDLQPIAEAGRYPLHWHHARDGSRGTIVEGVVVKNSTNRAYVPHASHGITIRDSIAKNIDGDAFWWDLPCACDGERFLKYHTLNNSNDSLWERNLVDGVNVAGRFPRYTITAFMLGAGSGNVIRDSVAMNVGGSKNTSGFHWPSQANQNVGGNVWVAENLRAHDVVNGIFVWQNDFSSHVISDFRAWDVTAAGVNHGAYNNNYTYENPIVDLFEAHAVGFQVNGGTIGKVRILQHAVSGAPVVFTDTQVGSVVVNDAGGVAGNFEFDNTGLTCDDVTLVAKAPGTTVKVDGVDCF